jgi:hypothetical protein
VHCDVHPSCAPVKVDTAELELALLNVCINAKDAMPDGGDLYVAARNAPPASRRPRRRVRRDRRARPSARASGPT